MPFYQILRGMLFRMSKRKMSAGRLQLYAFWTGCMSTLISLLHVLIIAFKK